MTFSASRIQTWMSCPRKAAWQYIAGYEDPGTSATDFGTLVHVELERLKREPDALPNMMSDVGRTAAEALPFVEDFRLDDPAHPARIEGEFTFHGRHTWRGFKDLSRPGEVVDYKTTSDFRWAKKPEDLLYDPQAVLYAHHEFLTWPGPTVNIMWLYLHKRKSAAMPVRLTVTREHAAQGFDALEAYADEMQAAADAAAAVAPPALPIEDRRQSTHLYVLSLPANTDHCGAYGGCPHRDRCGDLPFFSPKGNRSTVNLLDKVQYMLAGNHEAPTIPAPPQPVEETPLLGVPSPFSPAPWGGVVLAHPSGADTFGPSFFAAPTSAEDEPTSAEDAPSDAPATEPHIPVGVVASPNAVNPPPRRGRPPGAKNKLKDAAASPAPIATAVMSKAAGEATTAIAKELNALLSAPAPTETLPHRVQTLYVGCFPHGDGAEADIVDFDLLVSRAKSAIGEEAYFRDYGWKSNGNLISVIRQLVMRERPTHIAVYHPRSPEATLCLSFLRGIASTVVESVAA